MLLILYGVAIAVFAAWLAFAYLACRSVYDCQRGPPQITMDYHPATAVIIPVRGVPEHLEALWKGLCTQIFAPFRVVFAVESVADPAHAALSSLSGGPATEIVVAGPASRRGQKVHNLLAALTALKASDAVIVFADADIVPTADWLARLVRELSDPATKAVSGYRWMTPTDERWSSAFVCVANASIATLARPPSFNLAWGGSVALRRDNLEALDLNRAWDRALSDDLALSQALFAQGAGVAGPPDALVPTPTAMSWREAIAFGRRQYLLVRMHCPRQWILAAVATTIPLAGWAIALLLLARGDLLAVAVLLAANILDHLRAHWRRRVPMKLWNMPIPSRMAWLDRWGTPAYLGFHAAIVWSTLFGRDITWSGRTYRLDAKQRVVSITGPAAKAAAKLE